MDSNDNLLVDFLYIVIKYKQYNILFRKLEESFFSDSEWTVRLYQSPVCIKFYFFFNSKSRKTCTNRVDYCLGTLPINHNKQNYIFFVLYHTLLHVTFVTSVKCTVVAHVINPAKNMYCVLWNLLQTKN